MLLVKLHNCLVFHSHCLSINLYCQVFPVKSALPCVTCHCLKWKTIIIAGIKIPPFLWYVIHFFSSASTSGHLQYVYEISISSSLTPFNSSSSLPHSHTIYSVGSAPKCLSATVLALEPTSQHLFQILWYTKSSFVDHMFCSENKLFSTSSLWVPMHEIVKLHFSPSNYTKMRCFTWGWPLLGLKHVANSCW